MMRLRRTCCDGWKYELVDGEERESIRSVCGSDLWPYRGISPVTELTPMGHEYCGIAEEIGSKVRSIKPVQFVIGSLVRCST